jgi:hypothetical protein
MVIVNGKSISYVNRSKLKSKIKKNKKKEGKKKKERRTGVEKVIFV